MAATHELAASVLTDLLFEEPGVGRCLVAPDGSILRANAEWLRSTGFRADDVLGASLVDLFPDTRDMALAMHARARAGHRVEVPRHAQRVQGRDTWWEGSIAPVPMHRGTGLLITAREVDRDGPPPAHPQPVAGASRELLAAVVAHADVCIAVVTGTELRFALVNPAYQAIAPGTPMLGRTYAEVFPDAAARGSVARFLRVLETGEPWEVERWRAPVPRNPDARWQGRVVRLPSTPSEAPSALVVIRDVTAQSVAEDALRDEKERYRSLFEHSLDAVYLTTRDGTILDANRAACRMHDLTLDELKQRGRRGLVVNDGRHAAALEARAAAGHVRAEMTDLRKDGSTFPVEVESVLIDPARPDSPAFVIARDISERKRAEQELRAREEEARRRSAELEAVLDAVPAAVFIARDRDARTMDGNRFCAELLRIPLRTKVSKSADDPARPRSFRAMKDGVEIPAEELPLQLAASRGEDVRAYEFDLVFDDGEVRHLFGNATPLTGADGAPVGAVGAFLDITYRKQTEGALREALDRYERQVRLFEGVASTTPDFVYLFDRQGRILYANRRLLEVWGMALPEVIGRTLRELGYEQWHHDQHMREIARVIETRQPIKGEVPFKAPLTGIFGVYEYIFTPVLGPDGEVEIVAGTTRDVTERKQNEEALREADRRKDEFLGMLSHELRNPLAPIRTSIHVLRNADAGSEEARRAQGVIERQTEHLTRLVDDLLDVTRIGRGKIELRRSRVDLREIVSRAAEDFRVVMRDRGVAFDVVIPAAKLWADVDPTRITQVIGNLLHNASKFTRRGDTVTLSLAAVDGTAEIRVRDTGAGIEAALLPSVFDPFVQGERTLARTEGGLGLGLALVKGIAELHGGAVRAESAGAGGGAEFVVRLPLGSAGVIPHPSPTQRGRSHGACRVLVVDDNADAAESLGDLLSVLGYTVEVAYDGASAVDKARANPPDVVLCDIGLPGMSGYDVAQALRAAVPTRMRLIALSGYAQPEDVRRAIQAGFDAHVAKPADPAELERLLAR